MRQARAVAVFLSAVVCPATGAEVQAQNPPADERPVIEKAIRDSIAWALP